LLKLLVKFEFNGILMADELLKEIKENLYTIDIYTSGFNNAFEHDIQCIFSEISNRYEVDSDIKTLFMNLFNEFQAKQ
jgi:hypothetical protein